jgi:hypothetical protein
MSFVCAVSTATKKLSWLWTMKRMKTSVAMPVTTARKSFTLGGCCCTHAIIMPSGRFVHLISLHLRLCHVRLPSGGRTQQFFLFVFLIFLKHFLGRWIDGGCGLVIWPITNLRRSRLVQCNYSCLLFFVLLFSVMLLLFFLQWNFLF